MTIPRSLYETVYSNFWDEVASYLTPKEQKKAGIPKAIRQFTLHKQIMALDNGAILKKKLLSLHKDHPEWTNEKAAQVALKALHTFLSSYHIKPLSIAEKSYVAGRILERKALDLIAFFKNFMVRLIPEAAPFLESISYLNPIQKAKRITKWLEENKNHPQFSIPFEEMRQLLEHPEPPEEVRDLPEELSIIFGNLPEEAQRVTVEEIINKKNISLLKKLLEAYPENAHLLLLTLGIAIETNRFDLLSKALKNPQVLSFLEENFSVLLMEAARGRARMFEHIEYQLKDKIPQITQQQFVDIILSGREPSSRILERLIQWPQYKILSQDNFERILLNLGTKKFLAEDSRFERISPQTFISLLYRYPIGSRGPLFRIPAAQTMVLDSLADAMESNYLLAEPKRKVDQIVAIFQLVFIVASIYHIYGLIGTIYNSNLWDSFR
jgi:hypothetical protein